MAAPKPISLTQVDEADYTGLEPQPFVVVGDLPGGSGGGAAWGGITGTLASQTDLNTALNAKAPTASPTFTGDPKSVTPAVGDNDTSIATTAFVLANAGKAKTQITALAAVSAANAAPAAADPVTKAEYDVLVTLANANKAAINAIIAALKA